MATVLAELAEKIDPDKLAKEAKTAPIPWAQRLGYLLVRVGAGEKTVALKAYVQAHARDSIGLLSSAHRGRARRDPDWKLYINTRVQAEL